MRRSASRAVGGIVGHQHQAGARSTLQASEHLEHGLAGARVEVAGGLVGEEQRGPRRERARHRDALLLAARELRRIVVSALARGRPARAARRPLRPAPHRRAARAAAARSRARSDAGGAGRTGTRTRRAGGARARARPRRDPGSRALRRGPRRSTDDRGRPSARAASTCRCPTGPAPPPTRRRRWRTRRRRGRPAAVLPRRERGVGDEPLDEEGKWRTIAPRAWQLNGSALSRGAVATMVSGGTDDSIARGSLAVIALRLARSPLTTPLATAAQTGDAASSAGAVPAAGRRPVGRLPRRQLDRRAGSERGPGVSGSGRQTARRRGSSGAGAQRRRERRHFSAGGLRRLEWLLAQHPAVVVVASEPTTGCADWRSIRPSPTCTPSSPVRAPPAAACCCSGMMVPPNYGPDYAPKFAAMFPKLAKELAVPLVPFLLEGVGGRPELNQGDGIHPTRRGPPHHGADGLSAARSDRDSSSIQSGGSRLPSPGGASLVPSPSPPPTAHPSRRASPDRRAVPARAAGPRCAGTGGGT